MSLKNLRTNQSDINIFIIVRMTKLLGSRLWSKMNSVQVASASQEVRVGVTRTVRLYTAHSPAGRHDSRRWPPLSRSGNSNLPRVILLILLIISQKSEE
jgi:hypothetical protein